MQTVPVKIMFFNHRYDKKLVIPNAKELRNTVTLVEMEFVYTAEVDKVFNINNISFSLQQFVSILAMERKTEITSLVMAAMNLSLAHMVICIA